MIKNQILFSFVFFLYSLKTFPQSIHARNIHYRIIENKIEIFYDLRRNTDSLDLKLVFYKRSNSHFKYIPKQKFLTGDIGVGKFSGKNKKVTWNIKNEPKNVFTGSGFYFKVFTKRIRRPQQEQK